MSGIFLNLNEIFIEHQYIFYDWWENSTGSCGIIIVLAYCIVRDLRSLQEYGALFILFICMLVCAKIIALAKVET